MAHSYTGAVRRRVVVPKHAERWPLPQGHLRMAPTNHMLRPGRDSQLGAEQQVAGQRAQGRGRDCYSTPMCSLHAEQMACRADGRATAESACLNERLTCCTKGIKLLGTSCSSQVSHTRHELKNPGQQTY